MSEQILLMYTYPEQFSVIFVYFAKFNSYRSTFKFNLFESFGNQLNMV